ncbi:hypothetical protein OR1_03095 [Geobacter sp. OR-1]|uniref:DUF1638 domain-containing protein n=1 Tax=Geobacter sp. OR-1 TaxID=1266765 RepID=UPI000543531B|nr:DUF1638 domain-containing protein [Geobacter sp. OR-1]GAM10798.1 hypothetical protein OR1_03095 [Geobacter sp. OR-1]
MTGDRLLLLGCGILKKEVDFLIARNNWPMETLFLDSALHVDFDSLAKALTSSLARHREEDVIVLYGTCHPLMEQMLAKAGTFRTCGQNCCEMLLGNDLFSSELANGAYFLLEDWARRWDQILTKTFNTKNLELISDIFQGDRKYLLGIRTPCSGDFTAEAEAAGQTVGMPLHWLDVSLDHLESVLLEAITRKQGEAR